MRSSQSAFASSAIAQVRPSSFAPVPLWYMKAEMAGKPKETVPRVVIERSAAPEAKERLRRAYDLILRAAARVGAQYPSAEGISTSMDRENEEEV